MSECAGQKSFRKSVDSNLLIAAMSECAGQKSFRKSFRNSSQSRNLGYPPFFSSHWKIRSAHFKALPDFMYDRAHVILVCSEGKESEHRRMYVWHEVRKACPRERSPSNSFGSAGGGGRPIGMVRAEMVSGMLIFGEGGGLIFAVMSFSRCWKACRS